MSSVDDLAARRPAHTGSARGPERVLETLQRDAVTDLVGVLSGFWSTIEEQVRIAALAGHDFSAAQEDRVAIMALAPRALELATRYRVAIEQAFAHWREAEPREPEREGALELMSEGDLEIHLAGQQITELLDHQFLHPLTQLDERLEALATALGLRGKRLNPLRPAVAVTAFVELFEAEDLTPSLRRMVFQQFDKRLPKTLGDVYSKANATLAAAAFAPSTPAPRPLPPQREPAPDRASEAGEAWVPEGGTVEARHAPAAEPTFEGIEAGPAAAYAGPPAHPGFAGGTADGQPLRYRDIVREQLHAWRRHGGSLFAGRGGGYFDAPASDTAPAEVTGQFLGTEDMFNIASLLQGDDPAPYARALAGEDKRPLGDVLRSQILGSVRQLGLDPEQVRFSADEEDAIDLVGILFQSLVEANDLLQRARAMYGKLVMPYLKVALVDDSLFNRRSHPARKLLDALTEACDGNTGETARDQETLDHAERAVDRVVAEFQDDAAIFELAASELRDQLDQQRRRAEIAERRIAESIYGRERLQLARQAAEDLVASRLADRPLTAAVAQFLDEHWRHHLGQTWLRDGPESGRYREAIGLGDAMVQVDADAAQVRGAAVADQLLALQAPLGECYSSCGLDAASARDAMARIIAALAMPDTVRQVHTPRAGEVDGYEHDDGTPALRLVGGTDGLDFDPAIAARMRRLRVGQGVRLIDRTGQETAARIAWISPLTSRFLLVNRRGVRKLVVSPEELAVMVKAGRAVVRSVDAPFDEAMKQLWQRLNHAPRVPLAAANGG